MQITNAKKAVQKARKQIQTYNKEHFIGLYLDARSKVKYAELISLGTINACMVHPREVFHPAIKKRSTAIIVLHNHPSGEMEPSDADRELTKRLHAAGKLLGIEVLDHIIFDRGEEHYSFRDKGLI